MDTMPIAEVANLIAGDFRSEHFLEGWGDRLPARPSAGETMRYMMARWAYHAKHCTIGDDGYHDAVAPRCDIHYNEMRHGGPVQYIHHLAHSMREHGFDPDWPVEIYNGVLRDGHHRVLAAMLAGIAEIPYADADSADYMDLSW